MNLVLNALSTDLNTSIDLLIAWKSEIFVLFFFPHNFSIFFKQNRKF